LITRILALSPSSRGLGYAVMEPPATLVDWGVKSVKGDKNTDCLRHVLTMMTLYHPDLLVLEDALSKGSRRSPRIQKLCEQIVTVARNSQADVRVIPREKVRQRFFEDGMGSKHELAQQLAARFPEELGTRLPPKRKPWMSEDTRMDIFEAVALALVGMNRR